MAEKTRLQKFLALWPVITALIGGIASGTVGTYAWVSTQLEKRITRALDAHNRDFDTAAHPPIQVRLKALEDYWQANRQERDRIFQRMTRAEKQLYELYWFSVCRRAADLETDRRKRALACREAQERFRQFVEAGEGLKDAYRHALELPPPR
jgi:hypothetical protein